MGKLISAFTYLVAWIQMMWVGCTFSSENMEQCTSNVHVWLYPELKEGWKMLTNPCPYCDEQNAIQEGRDLPPD